MRKNHIKMFLPIFIGFVVLIPKISFAEFSQLNDSGRKAGMLSFRHEVKSQDGIKYEIRRIHIDGPYYDGDLGYNVLTIRKYQTPNLTGPKDIYTQLHKGQFLLFGFVSDYSALYSFSLVQQGAVICIKNIVTFDLKHQFGRVIGPLGCFQYGSPSPDGRHCILVDHRIIVVDLSDGSWKIIDSKANIESDAADPYRQMGSGFNVGGGVNLTGEFFEMVWDTDISGKIVIRNNLKEVIKEISITIK